jgi:tight adherence protein B
VSRAALMAFVAAGIGVAAAWDLLVAVERARVAAWAGGALRALRLAHAEGREPTRAERRRLALLAAGALLAGGWIVAGPVLALSAAVAGPGATVALLRSRRRAYRRRLAGGAAGVARALAAALSAGRSVRSAIGEAAAGLPGAAGNELRLVNAAIEAGEPTDAALERLRARAASPPWDTLVAGILLQRDAGGDLAALLRDQAAALEAAERIERDAHSATAQARFTARLVLLLPLGAAALAELASPGLLGGILRHPVSVWLVAMAAVLQGTAILAVARLARAR